MQDQDNNASEPPRHPCCMLIHLRSRSFAVHRVPHAVLLSCCIIAPANCCWFLSTIEYSSVTLHVDMYTEFPFFLFVRNSSNSTRQLGSCSSTVSKEGCVPRFIHFLKKRSAEDVSGCAYLRHVCTSKGW